MSFGRSLLNSRHYQNINKAWLLCKYQGREINVGTGISGDFSITFIKDNLLEEIDSNLKLKSLRKGGKEGEREDNAVDWTETVYVYTQNVRLGKEKR